jgi:hypothetical protein
MFSVKKKKNIFRNLNEVLLANWKMFSVWQKILVVLNIEKKKFVFQKSLYIKSNGNLVDGKDRTGSNTK